MSLYSLAGMGQPAGAAGISQGVGKSISALGMPLMFANPVAGGVAMGAGALTSLVSNIYANQAREAEGKRMYGKGQDIYSSKLAKHPNMYTTNGITKTFAHARGDMERANTLGTNSLLDRYSSLQRKQMRNKIRSGLTTGAAQAAQVQNNMAFQSQANKLFQNQGIQMSQLRLREGQAKANMAPIIEARKSQAARDALMAAGISNPSALGGLTSKLKGGY